MVILIFDTIHKSSNVKSLNTEKVPIEMKVLLSGIRIYLYFALIKFYMVNLICYVW